jgi:hypothetical protein
MKTVVSLQKLKGCEPFATRSIFLFLVVLYCKFPVCKLSAAHISLILKLREGILSMKNQKLYKTLETKKASQLGKDSQRTPKKATKKLGAHHAPAEEDDEK